MGNRFLDNRRVGDSFNYSNTGRDNRGNGGKSGMYYTSAMQGILAQKESGENKAADLLSEYLISLAERTYDEAKLTNAIDNMLNSFTLEERNRIISKALVRALCQTA